MRVKVMAMGGALLLAAGCGGDDDDAGSTVSTSSTTAVTTTSTTAAAARTYTVEAGDTLYDIALRFDTTVDALVQANALENPDSLAIGQVLVLPAGAAEDP